MLVLILFIISSFLSEFYEPTRHDSSCKVRHKFPEFKEKCDFFLNLLEKTLNSPVFNVFSSPFLINTSVVLPIQSFMQAFFFYIVLLFFHELLDKDTAFLYILKHFLRNIFFFNTCNKRFTLLATVLAF